MAKAWYVWNENDGITAIVFADTVSGARKTAWDNNSEFELEFDKYIDIKPRRKNSLDYLDKPEGYVMNWNNPKDRIALVKDLKWYCEDPPYGECEKCNARNYCEAWAEGWFI